MDTQLLTTKLYIPPACPNLVPRPRLLRQLDEGLRPGHKLTFVSAPAGFGKTTLLVNQLREAVLAKDNGAVEALISTIENTTIEPSECEAYTLYEIRVKGNLDSKWLDWFGGFTLTP